jgi:RHS repeat-associated protein
MTSAAAASLVKARYDYEPFGEQIASTTGGRSAIAGYSTTDSLRQKYTGYERDVETGLDFAQARYHSHTQGRFTVLTPWRAQPRIHRPSIATHTLPTSR